MNKDKVDLLLKIETELLLFGSCSLSNEELMILGSIEGEFSHPDKEIDLYIKDLCSRDDTKLEIGRKMLKGMIIGYLGR